ncbi:hypothetical protein PAT3040_00890 [Paenibacillus agaridevorans]|uniref:Glycosyltransferase 2-like domain-containing protein n=2 Tax=Paenibacillus agaridevorans TaxID=171404 RepID=A0A2R5EJU4_9BACL|nr:hypothetical protein PAT3040_00890 [Paenibacillus agaridevorans]
MPVYNGETFLEEAIESILNQTYRNFEFLIINDGSTDNSANIIEKYDDPRIRFINNEKNLKLYNTLNKGISLARGKYIARMDCDDISMPDRLEKQLAYMEDNPDVGITSGNLTQFIGQSDYIERVEHEEIRFRLLFYCCIVHPTVMMRKDFVKENNLLYKHSGAEDYDLWVRAIQYFKIEKLDECFLYYRYHNNQLTQTNTKEIKYSANSIVQTQLSNLNISADRIDWEAHEAVAQNIAAKSRGDRLRGMLILPDKVAPTVEWINYLIAQNREMNIYNFLFESHLNQVRRDILLFQEMLREVIKNAKGRKVYLFGSGKAGEVFLDYFNKIGFAVSGFLDNSPTRWGQTVQGIEVHNPDDLLNHNNDLFIIIATWTVRFRIDMIQQLKNIGLDKDADFTDLVPES